MTNDDKYEMRSLERLFKKLPKDQQQEVWLKYSEVMEGYSKKNEEQFELELMSDYTEDAIERNKNFGKMQGISSGYRKIDELTKGFVGGELTVIAGKTSYGKQQRVDEIIPTPLGDKRFGDLKVGDYVFGSDGKPTSITGVFPQGKLSIYRVNFSDGSYLDTGENHLWTLKRKNRKDRVLSSGDMLKKIPHSSYSIPLTKPLEYGDESEPIPAYELGMYISEGSMNRNNIHITKAKGDTSDYLQKLDDELVRYDHENSNGYLWATSTSKVARYIKSCGLADVKSHDKFIPNEWFNKTEAVRRKLLSGLLDGDGTFQKVPRYSTMSSKLADDVVRLVTSLGYMARKSIIKHHKGNYYQVRLNGVDYNPFVTSNNRDKWYWNGVNNRKHRYVKSIDILPAQEAMCISVSAQDSLYVADTRFNIVTHNTTLSINIANQVALAGTPVLFVTLEMTKAEITSRFMFINGGDTEDYQSVAPIVSFQATSELNWRSIDRLVKKFVKQFTTGLIVIDHLHYFTRELENVSEDLGRVTKELKKNAQDHNVPIILVSHVRKTGRGEAAGIDDLRGSSYIAQDADIVLLVGRKVEEPNLLKVFIEKNRNRGYDYKDNAADMYLDKIKVYNSEPIFKS